MPSFDASPLWRAVFWASYTAWFLSEVWIFWRDRRAVQGENVDRGSRGLLIAALYSGVFSAFWVVYATPGAAMRGPMTLLAAVGVALMWAGMGLRLWAVLTLGRFFRTSVLLQDDHRLVTDGPYRFLRNPSYTGALITLSGVGVALANWWSLALTLGAGLVAYGWRMRIEQRAMHARFGEAYARYKRRSWALIPFVW